MYAQTTYSLNKSLSVESGIYLSQSESKKRAGSEKYDNEFSQKLITK